MPGEKTPRWLTEASLYKLKVGPYATRQDAAQAADQAREALQLNPMVVERR